MSEKKIALFMCLSLLVTGAFCQSVNFFTKENPEITTAFSIAGALKSEVCTSPVIAETKVTADFQELNVNFGFAVQGKRFDATSKILYMPTIQKKCRYGVGVGLNHHFLRYFDTFSENDFLLSGRFHWYKSDFFDMEVAPGIMWKIASIDEIKRFRPPIVNFCFMLEYTAAWQFTPDFKTYFSFSSIDFFDYPLFGTPFIRLGGAYSFPNNVDLDMSVTMKFVDGIVSAVMLNQCILRTTVKVHF